MSEQDKSKNFLNELDQWTEANVIAPLESEAQQYPELEDGLARWARLVADVKYAIRARVLESYKNGCRAGAGHVRREYAEANGHTSERERHGETHVR